MTRFFSTDVVMNTESADTTDTAEKIWCFGGIGGVGKFGVPNLASTEVTLF
ncbi:MAG: hypothetical protein IPH31_25465 [Lewinellaceae bacterium]|nr:hypothetical protein [Lewinellaceae bacterium]